VVLGSVFLKVRSAREQNEERISLKTACCIIGAGYSYAGGLPLINELFEEKVLMASRGSRRRFEEVWRDYDIWRVDNPERDAEEYLRDIYEHFMKRPAPPFAWAVELIEAVLATPRGQDVKPINRRYAVRMTRPFRCESHSAFWQTVLSLFGKVSIVTTNYDLLIERCLRHRRIKRSAMPGFFYSGLARPQIARGVPLPWRAESRKRVIEIKGSVPLLKVHGSLNWAIENGELQLYQDVRPAFRRGGDAAIIPPLPEKETPEWLKPVWTEAESYLSEAEYWVVCGYSLPSYDKAIWQMLERAAIKSVKKIFVLDPLSEALRKRWGKVSVDGNVYCLSGLPKGTEELDTQIRTV